MVFQATTWGLKRVAARLLLVPALAGAATAAASAQPPRPGATMTAPGGDPKAMLKDGRKALAENRFNDARDLAQRAEASNPTGKWGLFDDTPNALRRDVEAAQAKAKGAEIGELTKQAKALYTRTAADPAEKARNLDQALTLARKADYLHGPNYSVWQLGDRPDRLVKDIEAARAKLPAPAPTGQAWNRGGGAPPGVQPAVAATTPAAPSGVTTAGATGRGPAPVTPAVAAGPKGPAGPPAAAPLPPVGPMAPAAPVTAATAPKGPMAPPAAPVGTDPTKLAAQRLMADAKRLADGGDFAAAHAKLTEAVRMGATFSATEPNPGLALQELSARGAAAIDRLVREANAQIGQKDFARAEAALDAAGEIAGALSLFPRPIEEAKTALRTASNGAHGGVPPGGLAPAGGPEALVRVPGPTGPLAPAAPATAAVTPAAPMTPTAPATAGGVTGRQLLDQANQAFKQGDFEAARRIALQAHNAGGSQAEARGLLNQIDAEVFAAKQRTAVRSLDAAAVAAQNKDHAHALGVLVLIDPNLLTADEKARRDTLMTACRAEVERTSGAGVVAAAAQQPAAPTPTPMTAPAPTAPNPPGTALIGPDTKAGGDNLAAQAEAMRKVTFQKLRADGLKAQADAQAAFGRGEADLAIQMLMDYTTRVRSAGLDAASASLLLRPVDSRLEMFRVMRGQANALAREQTDRREAREQITGRGAAEEQRKAEVQRLVRQYHALVLRSDYAAAERVAMQAKQLEPDDPGVAALAHMAKINRRVREVESAKSDRENIVYGGLLAAEKQGPLVDTQDPVAVRLEATLRGRKRGSGDDSFLRTRTPAEYEIELKLDRQVSLDFTQTPLSEAVDQVRALTGLPISWDSDAIGKAGVSTAVPVSEHIPNISARNALFLLLDKAKLSYVIEYDTVRITTADRAKGRLYTKVYQVADLVTPVPNFAMPEYADFGKMIGKNALNSGNVVMQGLNTGGPTPASVRGGLGGGEPAGAQASMPGIAGGTLFNQGGGNQLQNDPLAANANLAPSGGTKHVQLMNLITSLVRPHTWDGPSGGPGRLQYFDIGHALVVNQTADVIREVDDLLRSLRQLQDLAVAVEIRIISLSDTFFERMGVDFAMNIKTNNTRFEPQLTTNQFRPEPFINDINNKGVTVGLTPAGSFTPDLDVPIRSTSFQYAIPGFGNYPNNPGFNGGLSLGLAFLNDIQVFMFMEAAQGNRRVNVMQAPKITLMNGQTANLAVQDTQFVVTSVAVFSVNGQIVFVPQNNILPSTPVADPTGQIGLANVGISVQAVVSADRRFVRLNLPITMVAQSGATIPLFPITTFITPIFEGGSQGQPIPFTQFLQQPAFTTLAVQTTVVCPDGGTVLLGGLKTLGESRNEFGPPFLSKIPYLNRLFKNVGIGRETRHIMIMVTPRIIINAEEEFNQTEGGGPVGGR
jgi:type II secretory pathway component GspD/PulD (secretin)/tetratricopeptide (TPR) repeat protein